MKRAWVLWIAFGLVAVIGGGAWLFSALGAVEQPIAFNHLLHIEDVGAECTDCHAYARSGVRATIPNIEVCGSCHEEVSSGSPEEARLLEYIQSETPIPWKKVYTVPDHVYFSHRRHTAAGGIECEVCHGAVALSEKPVVRASVPPTMDQCMDCHQESGTSNDCIWCHR